ncbi:MAG: MOSC domain-containing protein [Pseudomonadota bacterium]
MIFKGKLLNIHIAHEGGSAMQPIESAKLIEGVGIEGDRYATGKGFYSSKPDIREVTLIDEETLIALKRDHDIELFAHEHRRNLTTRGVPLNHLVQRQFQIGDVILEGGRLNVPCKYLESLLDKKVYVPLLNRSGLNCRIVKGGTINVGDTITIHENP